MSINQKDGLEVISNNESNIIAETFQKAAYGDLSNLVSLYQQTNGLENCLPIMVPENLRQIIIRAADNLSELSIQMMEYLYDAKIESGTDARLLSELKPSIGVARKVKEILLSSTSQIDLSINHYEHQFQGFVNTLNGAADSYDDNAYIGGLVGGMIGSVFGPVGTIVGGILGGGIASNDVEDKLNNQGQRLCQQFITACKATSELLETMAANAMGLVAQYSESLDSADKKLNKFLKQA